MTPSQLQTLKAYILSVPALASKPMNSDGAYDIAQVINQVATPDFIVWRTSVAQDEITQNGFDWTRVDNLSIGAARVWAWMFDNAGKAFNPSKLNVRAGIDQVWKGVTADLAVRAVVYTHCYRPASVVEKILATGTGTVAIPATMSFEGSISYQDVQEARSA